MIAKIAILCENTPMRIVNIGDLKNHLSAYLQYVRNGEEVIVRDRNIPVARILPFHSADLTSDERELVAAGVMKMPEQPLDLEAFWGRQSGNVAREIALKAVLDSRADENR